MLVGNPVRGLKIRPDKRFYPDHEDAVFRPAGSRRPLVTHDFGPSTVNLEPTVVWPGGERNIFGKRIRAGTYKNFHLGIDISKGGCGADVLAAAKGKVLLSERNEFQTQIIVIGHGLIDGHRYKTGYAHLRERLVKVGDEVEAGDVIGKLGNTGAFSTGCHLHFFMKKDRRRVDPWRRLAQNTTIDPDAPVVADPEPTPTVEDPDVPTPASDNDYLAGSVAIVGNSQLDARVREAPEIDATIIREVPAGTQETWNPTCFVIGEEALGSQKWLARWFDGQWEYTHEANVRSVTPLGSG